tara:strand:- start:954 stop:2285 length:1332 start_codon:yes stop_codon:yes gene_type:complete
MNKVISAVLLGLGFSLSAFAQTATLAVTSSVPMLPKVWTGVAGDTSIGAISRKNPLHYLHVGEANEVKGWNKYDGPATLTILKQEGRHLELEFKNPKYQINEVGTLSADGKQIQIASKEASGLFTISGDKITGCGNSRGTNGLFGHWLGSYSVWCNEYTVGTTPAAPSTQVVATLPKVWTGLVDVTSMGDVSKHNPKSGENVGKEEAVKGWNTYDGPRTLTIIRQEGRHIEFLYKSSQTEDKWIGMLSADGKQMQIGGKYVAGIWNINGDQMSGCATGRGSNGTFLHWMNSYKSWCSNFAAGTSPPVLPQTVPVLPKEWQGNMFVTSMGATAKVNPKHADNVGKEKEVQGWNAYEAPIALTIVRQEGRHFEIVSKNPRGENRHIATLSADGKLLQIAGNTYQYVLNIAGNTLSGCANGHGRDGTFANWKDRYATACYDFAAKQ